VQVRDRVFGVGVMCVRIELCVDVGACEATSMGATRAQVARPRRRLCRLATCAGTCACACVCYTCVCVCVHVCDMYMYVRLQVCVYISLPEI